MVKNIGAAAALEECRALADRIDAWLSGKKPEPFVNTSSVAELQVYLELAAAILKKTTLPLSDLDGRSAGHRAVFSLADRLRLAVQAPQRPPQVRPENLQAVSDRESAQAFSCKVRPRFGPQGHDNAALVAARSTASRVSNSVTFLHIVRS